MSLIMGRAFKKQVSSHDILKYSCLLMTYVDLFTNGFILYDYCLESNSRWLFYLWTISHFRFTYILKCYRC